MSLGRINIVKMAILSKAIYRFSAITIKIPTQFITDMEKQFSTSYGIKIQDSQTTLNNKIFSGGIIITDCKLCYKAIVIKTAWYWYREAVRSKKKELNTQQ